jgi:hypothetical protein
MKKRFSGADGGHRATMELVEPTTRRIADTVCPIYREVPRGTPELIASAVLMRVDGLNLLCTAAHVLDARDSRNLYLPYGDTLQPFGARAIRTSLPGAGAADRLDVALMSLDDAVCQRFNGFRFVSVRDDVDPNDVPCSGRLYSFVGFPATKNKSLPPGQSVQPRSISVTGPSLPQEEYDRHGFNPATHLLVEFSRKRMVARDGSVQCPTAPHGLSGGPVWRIGDVPQLVNRTNSEKLVGIAIECRDNALVSVRISLVLELIRNTIAKESSAIPRSEYVGVLLVDVESP